MKVIKNINNNWVLCVDEKGKELVAFGKGLGFPKMPYELKDMSKINRTFYGVKEDYVKHLDLVDDDVFEISARIADVANGRITKELNPNLAFILADHINFCIERYRKKMNVKMPLLYDIQQLYPLETEIGEWAIQLINKVFGLHILEEEAIGIAMNIINAEGHTKDEQSEDELIGQIVVIIEKFYNIHINKKRINYSRFAMHMMYLLKRISETTEMSSDNILMLETLNKEYKLASECAYKIRDYLSKDGVVKFSEEEIIYLILHINRLTSRESI